MTHVTADALYELLPAIYRIRDDEQGGALRALVEILAQQGRLLERDVERLYDNAFIETCDEWAVPYIGDLLGVRNLHALGEVVGFSQRARVANTIAYRRRKGTATMLEQLATDTTGWPARAVEFFELVATTQHTNHPRLHNLRAPDLRDADALELIDTAFDRVAHTADVRRIASGRGRHNLPNVGLLLWRLEAYPFEIPVEARPVTDPPDGRYWLHPYGLDASLFNRERTEDQITHLAEEVHVPGPLRRRPLFEELSARRAAWEAGDAPTSTYFFDADDDEPAVFEVSLDGVPIRPEQVIVCDLTDWTAPAPSTLVHPDLGPIETRVSVDPVLGRLVVLGPPAPARVEVGYAYGFPGDVGGGPYDRAASLAEALPPEPDGMPLVPDWSASVSRSGPAPAGVDAHFATLRDALGAGGWAGLPPGSVGVVTIGDNASYPEALTGADAIAVPDGSRLVIVAAGRAEDGSPEPSERRAHLQTDVEVVGTAPADSPTPGTLVLDGFLIEGEIRVLGAREPAPGDPLVPASLGGLRVAHCTVGLQAPDAPVGIRVGPDVDPLADAALAAETNRELVLDLDHALCGPLEVPATARGVRLRDSVVQHADTALAGPDAGPDPTDGPPVSVERCTVFGEVRVREMTLGSESLFTDRVTVDRLQSGCVRFSYVPPGSLTPRRFRCQPDLALRRRAEALGLRSATELPPAERRRVLRRLRPSFTAVRYGEPAYAQLAASAAEAIRTGAEDGAEMGVWSLLKHPQRLANLRASLEDYLRFGLEAGLLFAT